MHIRLENSNLAQLRAIADRSVDTLLLADMGSNKPMLDILSGLLDQNKVRIQKWDLGDEVLALHLHEPNTGEHFLVINEKLLAISDEATRKMATKRLFCHELSHILLQHPASFLPPEDGGRDAVFRNTYKSMMQFASNPLIHGSYESEAEIFSSALGFWPLETFAKRVRTTKLEFGQIANEFKMPLDCAVKWALIWFRLPMHYLKYNVSLQSVEDFFIPSDPDYDLFPWEFRSGNVFKDEGTTACKCMQSGEDAHGVTKTKLGNKEAAFFCRAIRQKPNPALWRRDEKIIICGVPNSLTSFLSDDARQP